MFSNLRGSEWLILILLIVLLFGAKRLPDAARGIGRSLRIFKAETKGLSEEGDGGKKAAVESSDAAPADQAATAEKSPAASEPAGTTEGSAPESGKPAAS